MTLPLIMDHCSDYERRIRSGLALWSPEDRVAVLVHTRTCEACRALLGESSGAQVTPPRPVLTRKATVERPAPALASGLPNAAAFTVAESFGTYRAPASNHAPGDPVVDLERLLPDPNKSTLAAVEDPSESTWPTVSGYDLLARIGRGGMGVVFKARQRQLNRLVALKMIRDSVTASPQQLLRIQIEAQAVARLRHPNIVQIYEIGEANGMPFLALELLEGGSLDALLKGIPQPRRQSAKLVATLAEAIEAAHQARVIHRDLKPGNIVLAADGTPKITDFGLAKSLEAAAEAASQTKTGEVMGSPSYMAPEQARGEISAVGPPTDVYALGAILYEMLTGRPPFRGASVWETIKQVIEEEPVPPSRLQSQVPRDLETICLKCLAKEPNRRYLTAQALADDLHRWLADEPIQARPIPFWERGVKWARRHPMGTVRIIAAAVTLIAGAAAATVYSQQALAHRLEIVAERDRALNSLGNLLARDPRNASVVLAKVIEFRAQIRSDSTKAAAADYQRQQDTLTKLEDRARQKIDVQSRLDRFRDRRDPAFFLSMDVALLGKAAGEPAVVLAAALQALQEVAGPNGQIDPAVLEDLASRDRADLIDRWLELTLIRAEAQAEPTAGTNPEAAARAGLAILADALKQGPGLPETQAWHRLRGRLLARTDDPAGSQAEFARNRLIPAHGAFDSFEEGLEAYRAGQTERAAERFWDTLARDSHHFWARCLLGLTQIQLGRPALAQTLLVQCRDDRPDLPWIGLLLGFAQTRLVAAQVNPSRRDAADLPRSLAGSTRPTTSNLAATPAPSGKDREPWRDDFAAAEATFAAVATKLPATADNQTLRYALHLNRGLGRSWAGDHAGAATDFAQAIAIDPRPHSAYVNWALNDLQTGQLNQAIERLTAAIDQPEVQGLEALRSFRAHLVTRRAQQFAAILDPIESLQRGAQPTNPAQAAFVPIGRELQNRDRTTAIAEFAAITRGSQRPTPEVAADLTQMVDLLAQSRRHEEVLSAVKQAIQLAPRHADLYRWQISALLALGRDDEVADACEAYLQTGTPSAEILALASLARIRRWDVAGAIDGFTQALRLDPIPPALRARILIERGQLHLGSQELESAERDFEAAIQVDHDAGDAYSARGLVRLKQGADDQALADAARALRCSHSSANRLLDCARIYATARNFAPADPTRSQRTVARPPWSQIDTAARLTQQALETLPVPERAACYEKLARQPAFVPVLFRIHQSADLRPRDASRLSSNRH